MAETTTEDERPAVSVCLLTYNHVLVVEDAVRSILAQKFDDFELIISDDCSSDGTYEAIQKLAAGNPRVRLLRTPGNLGMAGNANFAVRHARGGAIALLHHDDIYSPELLSRWFGVLERHPTVGFVSNAYGYHHSDMVDRHPFAEFNPGREVLARHMLPQWGCPVRGTALIRKSSWDAVGGMRERYGMLADVDLWMRLASGFDVGYVAEPIITVRHEVPDYYPKDYWAWSWRRMKLAYEIYGDNHLGFYGDASVRARVRQQWFRVRVNTDITKWLAYAVVKRRHNMLRDSADVANRYEFAATRWLRRGLARVSNVVALAEPSR